MKKILLSIIAIFLLCMSALRAQTTSFGYGADSGWDGLGIGAKGVKLDVAIFVPGDGVLKGTTVKGINIPVLDAGMTNVSVWLKSSLSGAKVAEATATGSFVARQYFTVEFEEPVVIPQSGLYAGYSFTCSIEYPIAMGGNQASGGLFLNYTYNGSASGWQDYSDSFPPSAMQVLLEGVTLSDYSVEFTQVGTAIQVMNESYEIPVSIVSNSSQAIQNLDVEVSVDGQTETKHIELTSSIKAGLNQIASFRIKGTSPAKTGRFDVDVAVKNINGVPYEGNATATGLLKNLTRKVVRRTVIEEFTGTGCGYCPRGWVGMEYMKANYPERFVGIAFHKYNSSDAMYNANYPFLGLSGAPACMIDRKEEADPYYGFSDKSYGIVDAFELLNKEIPEVEVNVEAQWNEEESAVEVNADVEFLVTPVSVSLVYVLTADSLSGTTSAWKQSNYYYQYTADQMDNEAGIVNFCKNGIYGKSTVALTFNDVLIGSSYNTSGTNMGECIEGKDGFESGSFYQGSYTINSPTKTTLKNALKKHLIYAVVLIVDNETGEILNANKSRVATVDAILDVAKGKENAVSARYNLAGQVIAAPQRGLNIVRMVNGNVKKVLVK